MSWQTLSSKEQLELLLSEAEQAPLFAIFKHSTRCSISAMAYRRLQQEWESQNPDVPIYYLDLLADRSLSNYISERLGVHHESPQLIMVHEGKSIYHASHMSISASKAAEVKANVS